jgi:hypothetical protein
MVSGARSQGLLSALRDVDGVLGGFVIDAFGGVIARDMPLLFEPEAFERAAEHVGRLRAALESDGRSMGSCVVRFGEHLLLLRSAGDDTLCVVCPRGTNVPAVQMSCTLVTRQLFATRDGASTRAVADEMPESVGARRFRGRSL